MDHLQVLLLSFLESGPCITAAMIRQVQERTGGFFDLQPEDLERALQQLEAHGQIAVGFHATTRAGTLQKQYNLTAQGLAQLQTRKPELEHLSCILPFLLR
ncbi:PadR family transcriptional regulator [Deinococcus roseus]|nr:helix-turn-helix transcriptional regulator [Deinococcus roseus]